MAPTRPYRSYATGESSGFVTVAEGPGMAAGQLFVRCCARARVRCRSSRVPICQGSTVDRSGLLTIGRGRAPTAEMMKKNFGVIKKWSGHGRPSHYGSDALVDNFLTSPAPNVNNVHLYQLLAGNNSCSRTATLAKLRKCKEFSKLNDIYALLPHLERDQMHSCTQLL